MTMPKSTGKIILILAILLPGFTARANVTLPALFSDHMVLQQNSSVAFWGWAKPGETVRITASWDAEKEYRVQVGRLSAWTLEIETPPAGGPYRVVVSGYNTIEIEDVLVGEVWLGSGQSNMEWTPSKGILNAEEEIAGATYPEIRFFTVNTLTAGTPQQLVSGAWVRCSPETMAEFSALLYFFGRELHLELGFPVGLINASWGGTPIEIWMPEPSIRGDRQLDLAAGMLKPVPWGPTYPGSAYNAMIHPLIPFGIKGALWYQGEGNVDYPGSYARALKTLVESWRSAWGYEFPFYYAQIAPWSGYGADNVRGAVLRDQQRLALARTEKTGMAVLSDIGNLQNIHPENKQDVGKRLAAWALHQDYGMKDRAFSGPLFRSFSLEGGKAILHFDHAGGGLISRDGALREFEILDENGGWIEAKATVSGQAVEVMLPAGGGQGVRYAYRNDSNPNLFNQAGLPASCFEVLFNSSGQ